MTFHDNHLNQIQVITCDDCGRVIPPNLDDLVRDVCNWCAISWGPEPTQAQYMLVEGR